MESIEDKLVQAVADRGLIVFAGAGVAEPSEVPMWLHLLKCFEAEDKASVQGIDLDKYHEMNYPEAAQAIYNKFEIDGNIARYYEILQNNLHSRRQSHSHAQQEMVLAADHIVTTNFDTTFDAAVQCVQDFFKYKTASIGWQALPELKPPEESDRLITHIHGRVGGELVFKTTDYGIYYPKRNRQNSEEGLAETIIRAMWESMKVVVFVGFSFSDRYVTETLRRLHLENNASGKVYGGKYALIQKMVVKPRLRLESEVDPIEEANRISEDRRRNQRHKIEQLGIEVIEYTDHQDIETIFKMLFQVANIRRSSVIVGSS
jgi:hypothetical protein